MKARCLAADTKTPSARKRLSDGKKYVPGFREASL